MENDNDKLDTNNVNDTVENNTDGVRAETAAPESQPVQNVGAGDPAGYVYRHSFYENSTGPQPAGPIPGNPGMPDQNVSYASPVKEDKKKEVTFRKGRLAISFLCVILATSILTSAASYSIWNHYQPNRGDLNGSSDNSSASTSQTSSSSSSTVSRDDSDTLSIAEINKIAGPSVVFIGVEVASQNMFGQQITESGSGSGIILSSDGYIMTNNHVIDGATSITVQTIDGKTYPATLIGKDAKTDLALLKINATGLTAATLGDSSSVEVGDLAIAIGNPLGTLDGTLTVGVISALDREVTIDNITMNLMQTDAAVNPGNSGGALVNEYGEVIGVVNAKTSAVGIEGLGYAIPVNDAKIVIEDLKNNGFVTGRIKIGISTEDITSDFADDYDLPVGIYVVAVEAGSSADKAGIKAKDVIIGVDGEEVLTTQALSEIRDSHKVGESIKILINRGGKEIYVTLVFEQDTSAS